MATNNALNLGLSGSTGTGSFVGSSAPTIVNGIWQSPTINSPSGTVLTVSSTGTPVNQFVMTASPTTAAPVLSAAGTDTNILLQINGKGTSGLGLQGTSTNSNAVAGNVGEFVDSGAVSGTYTVSTTVYNVTSISLTAGDWDVYGSCQMIPSTFNTNNYSGGINTTSATIPANGLLSKFIIAINGTGPTGLGDNIQKCFSRISISSTTTVYLCSQAQWAGGSAPTYSCQLAARRVR